VATEILDDGAADNVGAPIVAMATALTTADAPLPNNNIAQVCYKHYNS
jgi:hypothetical protein